MSEILRVANCGGFYGDRLTAAHEMVEGGPIDVLTGGAGTRRFATGTIGCENHLERVLQAGTRRAADGDIASDVGEVAGGARPPIDGDQIAGDYRST